MALAGRELRAAVSSPPRSRCSVPSAPVPSGQVPKISAGTFETTCRTGTGYLPARLLDDVLAQPDRPLLGMGGDHDEVGMEFRDRLVHRMQRSVVPDRTVRLKSLAAQDLERRLEAVLGRGHGGVGSPDRPLTRAQDVRRHAHEVPRAVLVLVEPAQLGEQGVGLHSLVRDHEYPRDRAEIRCHGRRSAGAVDGWRGRHGDLRDRDHSRAVAGEEVGAEHDRPGKEAEDQLRAGVARARPSRSGRRPLRRSVSTVRTG